MIDLPNLDHFTDLELAATVDRLRAEARRYRDTATPGDGSGPIIARLLAQAEELEQSLRDRGPSAEA